MPIISLKNLKRNKSSQKINSVLRHTEQVKRPDLATLLFGLLIFIVIVFYYGPDVPITIGVILLLVSMFSLELLFFKTFHPEILKEPGKVILMEIVVILMLSFIILIETMWFRWFL